MKYRKIYCSILLRWRSVAFDRFYDAVKDNIVALKNQRMSDVYVLRLPGHPAALTTRRWIPWTRRPVAPVAPTPPSGPRSPLGPKDPVAPVTPKHNIGDKPVLLLRTLQLRTSYTVRSVCKLTQYQIQAKRLAFCIMLNRGLETQNLGINAASFTIEVYVPEHGALWQLPNRSFQLYLICKTDYISF